MEEDEAAEEVLYEIGHHAEMPFSSDSFKNEVIIIIFLIFSHFQKLTYFVFFPPYCFQVINCYPLSILGQQRFYNGLAFFSFTSRSQIFPILYSFHHAFVLF